MKQLLHRLGPGLLMAGAAVGVSHLVQSTRAGAIYGWAPLIFILVANIFKYPFYEYGHRYAAVTGDNLLRGYKQVGRPHLIVFLLLNLISSIGSVALLSFITAGLLQYLLFPDIDLAWIAGAVLLLCWIILAIGHYVWLEHITKWLMVFLTLATCAAVITALWTTPLTPPALTDKTPETLTLFAVSALPFLIAFMGWMPGPMEISVWQSLWVQAESKARGADFVLHHAQFDFNVGYWLTAGLACCFLAMGALALQGQPMSDKAAVFAGQVVSMYGNVIGAWSVPFVGLAAVTAIFSTTFTLMDAYPRSFSVGLTEVYPSLTRREPMIRHVFSLCIIAAAIATISQLQHQLQLFVRSVTIIAFFAAPYVAWLNIRCIATLEPRYQPARWIRALAVIGMAYLVLFSLLYQAHMSGLL